MANFDNIKEIALDSAGKVADKTVSIAKTVGEKAKLAGKITKLRTEIAVEKDTARKAYYEIGKLYFEKHGKHPDPEMAQAVAEVGVALEKAAAKLEEVGRLKKQLVAAGGTETVEEAVEDAVKVVAKKVEETVDEVTDTVKEVAEEIEDKID